MTAPEEELNQGLEPCSKTLNFVIIVYSVRCPLHVYGDGGGGCQVTIADRVLEFIATKPAFHRCVG